MCPRDVCIRSLSIEIQILLIFKVKKAIIHI